MILALIPLFIVIINVAKYRVDVPFWDQWNFVPLLGKSYEQGVTLSDLWSQHNEHRLFFPRLLMLGLAHASHYDIVWELAVILILAALTFGLLWRQFLKMVKALGYSGVPRAVPIFSLLVFSLGQAENWLWGWQIQIFLNVLAVVAGLSLLGGGTFRWRRFWGALGLGILATYSFANGLIFWPLGFLAIMLAPPGGRRQKTWALTAWIAASAGIVVSYLYRFRFQSPSGRSWTWFLNEPGDYLRYILKYLGRPVINYEGYALTIGLIGLLLFGLFSFRLFRKKRGDSREIRTRVRARPVRILSLAGIGVFTFVLVFGMARTSYRVGHQVFKSYHSRMSPARAELLRGEDEQLLLRLYIDADYIRQGIDVLKKHSLSVFR